MILDCKISTSSFVHWPFFQLAPTEMVIIYNLSTNITDISVDFLFDKITRIHFKTNLQHICHCNESFKKTVFPNISFGTKWNYLRQSPVLCSACLSSRVVNHAWLISDSCLTPIVFCGVTLPLAPDVVTCYKQDQLSHTQHRVSTTQMDGVVRRQQLSSLESVCSYKLFNLIELWGCNSGPTVILVTVWY